jgi:hypothetical protein
MSRSRIAAGGLAVALMASSCQPAEDLTTQSEATRTSRFTYEDLVGLIQGHGIRSVEELLAALPDDLRSSYVLLHDSRSLQGASAEYPRVILFGLDARLTCAFAGDPSLPGFDSLECFQFREPTSSFDFRQIRFPTSDNGLGAVAFSSSNQSTDGKIQYTQCHGADPRPNWDAYDQWPGAYGAEDDTLKDDAPRYAAFVARRPTDARYRWLIQGSAPTDPYMAGDAIGIMNRPNLRLSDAFGRMNALRAARILEGRVPSRDSLAFAVKVLQCSLSSDQQAALTQAGVDANQVLDPDRIFAAVGMSGAEWGTQIFDDPEPTRGQPWEHQAGFTFLSADVGMVVAQERARAGNATLKAGLDRVAASWATRYTGAELRHYAALNELVPDPDRFGEHYTDNIGAVCPELTRLFVAEAVAH